MCALNRSGKEGEAHLKKYIKENIALIITIVFTIISLILWIFSTKELDLSDLWLNLLSGFIASVCTIFVIDNILKKQKEKDEKPLRLAFYREVQLFTSRMISFWTEMYIQSNNCLTEIEIDSLFSKSVIDSIYSCLDLEGKPNVIPEQNWFAFIQYNLTDLVKRGNKILDRNISMVEPELFEALYHLINDSPFIGYLFMVNSTHSIDVKEGIPRCPLLSSYVPKPQEKDYKAIETLFKWCRKEYSILEKSSTIYKVDRIISMNSNNSPSSIMTEERIEYFSIAMENWRNSKK